MDENEATGTGTIPMPKPTPEQAAVLARVVARTAAPMAPDLRLGPNPPWFDGHVRLKPRVAQPEPGTADPGEAARRPAEVEAVRSALRSRMVEINRDGFFALTPHDHALAEAAVDALDACRAASAPAPLPAAPGPVGPYVVLGGGSSWLVTGPGLAGDGLRFAEAGRAQATAAALAGAFRAGREDLARAVSRTLRVEY